MNNSESNKSSFSNILFIDVMSVNEIKEEPVDPFEYNEVVEIVEVRKEKAPESLEEIKEDPIASLKDGMNDLNYNTIKNDKLNFDPEEKYHQLLLQPYNADIKIEEVEIDGNSSDGGMKTTSNSLQNHFESDGASSESFKNEMRENLREKTNEQNGIKMKVNSQERKEITGSFCCSLCEYKTKLKRNYKSHLSTHSNKELFKCSECDYECERKGNLKLHLLRHSSTDLFKCLECDYVCNQKNYLKRHSLIHSNTKLFKCSECSYESNRKHELNHHLLSHSKTKLSEKNYLRKISEKNKNDFKIETMQETRSEGLSSWQYRCYSILLELWIGVNMK